MGNTRSPTHPGIISWNKIDVFPYQKRGFKLRYLFGIKRLPMRNERSPANNTNRGILSRKHAESCSSCFSNITGTNYVQRRSLANCYRRVCSMICRVLMHIEAVNPNGPTWCQDTSARTHARTHTQTRMHARTYARTHARNHHLEATFLLCLKHHIRWPCI